VARSNMRGQLQHHDEVGRVPRSRQRAGARQRFVPAQQRARVRVCVSTHHGCWQAQACDECTVRVCLQQGVAVSHGAVVNARGGLGAVLLRTQPNHRHPREQLLGPALSLRCVLQQSAGGAEGAVCGAHMRVSAGGGCTRNAPLSRCRPHARAHTSTHSPSMWLALSQRAPSRNRPLM
jgi:hypothetical protein